MPCSIDWCAFTWEAFATLTTGALAVGGAVFIGLRQLDLTREQSKIASRQADVASRQADLLEHQVQVDRANLRADLFERRLAVYKACKAYIREAIRAKGDFDGSLEVAVALGEQLEQAQFLFSGEVRRRLEDAAERSDELLGEREVLRDLRTSASARTIEGRNAMQEQAEKVREMNSALRSELAGLAETMGDEMRLYIPAIKETVPSAKP